MLLQKSICKNLAQIATVETVIVVEPLPCIKSSRVATVEHVAVANPSTIWAVNVASVSKKGKVEL